MPEKQCPQCKSIDIGYALTPQAAKEHGKDPELCCNDCGLTGYEKDFLDIADINTDKTFDKIEAMLKKEGWTDSNRNCSNGTETLSLTNGPTIVSVCIRDRDEEEYLEPQS